LLPEAHCSRKYTHDTVYLRVTAGREKGAAVLGRYKGASLAEAENAMADDEDGLRERYDAAVSKRPTLTTIAGLLNAWERSAEFEGKSESTKRERSRLIKSISESPLGKASSSILKQPTATGAITKWRDKAAEKHGARSADARMEVINTALNWNVRQGNIAKNPAAGIADVYLGDRSDMIWEPAMVETFRQHIRDKIMDVWTTQKAGPKRHDTILRLVNAHDALTLAINTGMRRTDLSLFAWLWVRDGAIVYTPQKGRNRARTSKKPARVVVLPILADAARVLARRFEARSGPTVLENRDGAHYQPKGIGDLVADVAKALKIERHLHDAKGTFVTRLRTETDLTDEEIAGLVDWSKAAVQSIIRRYLSNAAVTDALLKRFKRS
jgi:hypothetical protein